VSGLQIDVDVTCGDFSLRAAFSVQPRETVALVGPNGAGKTTLLRCVLGVLTPDRGEIRIGDRALFESDTGIRVPTEQRHIGYMPQDYGLFPHLNVVDNVSYGLDARSRGVSRDRRRAQLVDTMRRFDLEPLATRRPADLSGGERQRVALARALASGPDVLLLDEPLAALDIAARRNVRESLATRLGGMALPTLLVTHDPADVRRLANRVVVLEEGRVTASGDAESLGGRTGPTPFVREFLG
jgi:molybdate transport system ATP-binding protein